MLQKHTFLSILFLLCSCSDTIILKANTSIQTIYDFDAQGAFDQPGLIPSEQLSDYIKTIETNLEKNKSLLQEMESSWWKNIAQKIAAFSSIGLGGYGYYWLYSFQMQAAQSWYSSIEDELNWLNAYLAQLEILQRMKENREVPNKLKEQLRMPRYYDEHPEDVMFDLKMLEKEVPSIKKRIANIENTATMRNIISYVAPAAILSGLALFGYNLYQNINKQKEKALEAIRKDNMILDKLKKLQNI